MNDKIVIIGGYGTALNIAETIHQQNLNVHGFVIDDTDLKGHVGQFKVISPIIKLSDLILKYKFKVVFALYKPEYLKERFNLFRSLKIPFENIYTFIHGTSYVSSSAKIGRGVVIMPNCTIQSNVVIHDNTIVNSNCVIEHDSTIGKGCFISTGTIIGASTTIQNHVFIGMMSALIGGIFIDEETFIGMGSNVVKSINGLRNVVYGNPAKIIKKLVK